MSIKNHLLEGVRYVNAADQGGVITPTAIIMHYTAGYTLESALTTLTAKALPEVSAHVVVDLDGVVVQMVPFNKRAFHAGPSVLDGRSGVNGFSIGIEIVNPGYFKTRQGYWEDAYGNKLTAGTSEPFAKNTPLTRMHDWLSAGNYVSAKQPRVGSEVYVWPLYRGAQLDAVEEIVRDLKDAYPSIYRVATHEEIDTRGWKSDPGPAFPLDRFRRIFNNRSDHDAIYIVRASRLNVREAPSPKGAVVNQLPFKTPVVPIRVSGDWTLVRKPDSEEVYGWVSTAYLERSG